MKLLRKTLFVGAALSLIAGLALAQESPARSDAIGKNPEAATGRKPDAATTADPNAGVLFQPESVGSEGSVTVGGQKIDYHAVAGTIVVHPRGWDDAAKREKAGEGKDLGDPANPQAEASMFYVAYFKKVAPANNKFLNTSLPPQKTCAQARPQWASLTTGGGPGPATWGRSARRFGAPAVPKRQVALTGSL
jgi:hypothetical protein